MSEQSTTPVNKNYGWWFGVAGVLAAAGIAVGLNYISRNIPVQIDFTDNKFYSLTEGTKKIIDNIDTDVDMTLFVSDNENLPPQIIGRVRDVESLLVQYLDRSSKGHLKLKKINPAPDTEAAEQAALAGVQPDERVGGAYFTLSVNCLDKRENIEFLPLIFSRREELFEYEITRAISNVTASKKKKIGVMSALPIAGDSGPAMMMQQQGRKKPWVFYQQLKRDYDVTMVEMTAETVADDIDALVLIHPAGITEGTEYAIDQFVLKGKPVVVLLDPMSLAYEGLQARNQNPMMRSPDEGNTSSNLPKLLPAWGYSFDPNVVLADAKYTTPMRDGAQSPIYPTFTSEALAGKDPVVGNINELFMGLAGAFSGSASSGLTADTLVKSSTESDFISSVEAKTGGRDLLSRLKSSGQEKIVALRLSGKFKTAFPDGKPKKTQAATDEKKEGEAAPAQAESLKEMVAGKDGVVILIGDSDFIFDPLCVQMLGPDIALPMNGNLPFGMNIIDQVAGDTNLVQIRSRGATRRPFAKINEIERQAEQSIQAKVEQLQQEAQEANNRLNELQAAKDPKQKSFLSAEQKAEIDNFRNKQVEASRKIRELKKEARKEIDSKLASMKLNNIVLMPLIVIVLGLVVFFTRKSRTSAK